MAVVSEQVYSGRETVKLLYRFISKFRNDPARLRDLFAYEKAYRPVAEPILEETRVEHAYAPGDALTGWQIPSPFALTLAEAGLAPGGVVIVSPVVIPV